MQPFGTHLRRWRRARGLSQLALANETATSARHLSFLESGRSVPGREMVMRLAAALAVAPGELDAALVAAGHAPSGARPVPLPEDAPALERAIGSLLEAHAPLPGIALDERWYAIGANAGAARLMALTGAAGPPSGPSPDRLDLVAWLAAHARPGGALVNGREVAAHGLARARIEHARTAPGSADERRFADCARRLEAVLEAHGDAPERAGTNAPDRAPDRAPGERAGTATTLALRVERDAVRLSLRSVLIAFTALDRPDVRAPTVELFYAEDETTAAWFEAPP